LLIRNLMSFNKYYNAKLLLTAEYLVLNGAEALAVPLKFGQRLQVEENKQGYISWKSVAHDGSTWFSGKYDLEDFNIIQSSNPDIAVHPQRLMRAARKLENDFLSVSEGCNVVSTLNYPLLWGLGSSSTLIAAVAGWAGTDPFKLHFEVSKGSGYDIACALSEGPILYSIENKIPSYGRVIFSPSFADKIFFVYQGKKQDSAEGIVKFLNRNSEPDPQIVKTASLLTRRMLQVSSLTEFEQVIQEHEIVISAMLGVSSVGQTLFPDLPGAVKSLGAWGGDFCMLTWNEDPALLAPYLKSKGLETWFNFSDIVL